HPSDNLVFMMKMEILLEPTSNKIMVEDLFEDQLVLIAVSSFSDDPYMKDMQAYYSTNELPIPPPATPIAPPPSPDFYSGNYHRGYLGFLEPLYLGFINMVHNQDIEHMIPPTPPRDTEPPIGLPMPLSPSLSVGSSSLVRSTTPPPDYPFDESIFAELDNSLWIILRPLGSEPTSEEPNEMDTKRTSTSSAPAMTQAAIRKLVAESVTIALEA
nr:hypothetical protein [Tanacetum cinerariifolium]